MSKVERQPKKQTNLVRSDIDLQNTLPTLAFAVSNLKHSFILIKINDVFFKKKNVILTSMSGRNGYSIKVRKWQC